MGKKGNKSLELPDGRPSSRVLLDREIQELVTAVSIGTEIDQKKALKKLKNLASEDGNREAMVTAALVSALVKILRDGSEWAKETSIGLLLTFTPAQKSLELMVDLRALLPILAVFQTSLRKSQLFAFSVLGRLSHCDTRKDVVMRTTLPVIIQMLTEGANVLQESAAQLISEFAIDAGNRESIAAAGAIPLLVQLLSAGSETAQYVAARALYNLATEEKYQKIIAAAGAISSLVRLLSDLTVDDLMGRSGGALWFLPADEDLREFL